MDGLRIKSGFIIFLRLSSAYRRNIQYGCRVNDIFILIHSFIYIDWYWILIESIVSLPYFFYQVFFSSSFVINCWTIILCYALLNVWEFVTEKLLYVNYAETKAKYSIVHIMSTSLPNTLTFETMVWGHKWIINST